MKSESSQTENIKKYIATSLGALLLSLTIVHLFQSLNNRLALHENWVAAKDIQGRDQLPGTREFLLSPYTMAGNKVNLASWGGGQELIFKKKVKVKKLKAILTLEENSYILFKYNTNDLYSDAIRLSTNKGYPSAFLKVFKSGKFDNAKKLKSNVKTGKNTIELLHEDDIVQLKVNNHIVIKREWEASLPYQVSFVGGHRDAYLNEVFISTHEGEFFSDSFYNTTFIYRTFTLILFSTLAISIGGLFLARTNRKLKMVIGGQAIIAFTTIAAYFLYVNFPDIQQNLYLFQQINHQHSKNEKNNTAREFQQIFKEIKKLPQKNASTRRVLFVGGSQTYGIGAGHSNQIWTRKYCDAMRASARFKIECYNASVPNIDIQDLLDNYQQLLEYKPDYVIFVMGAESRGSSSSIEADYRAILNLSLGSGIKTYTVLQPWKDYSGRMPENYVAISRVARSRKSPIINAPSKMKSYRDSGLIWWDRFHLTPYGHSLMAKIVYESIKFMDLEESNE